VTDRTYDSDGLDEDLKQDGVNETLVLIRVDAVRSEVK